MKVKSLKPDNKVDYLTLKIATLSEAKTFATGVVQEGQVQDETGTVDIVFFGKDADKYKAGDIIAIKNGWCKMFRNRLQVQAGKFGKIEIFKEKVDDNADDDTSDAEDLSMFEDTTEDKRLREELNEFGVE